LTPIRYTDSFLAGKVMDSFQQRHEKFLTNLQMDQSTPDSDKQLPTECKSTAAKETGLS
jgi:hypothetical protein